MNCSTGKLAFIVIAAVLLAFIAAWVIAGRSAAQCNHPCGGARPSIGHAATRPLQPVSAQDNRRAELRLALLPVGLSALMALSSAALSPGVDIDDRFSFKRLGVFALVRRWPVIPALGLM